MNGTFAFCRTKEAIRRMLDGDIIQNLESEEYYKWRSGTTQVSTDCVHWFDFNKPIEVFPPYVEWRSLSNLHYYDDLKKSNPQVALSYLTIDEKIVDENHPKAHKNKKRWFIEEPLL